jgi:hypothetical protein
MMGGQNDEVAYSKSASLHVSATPNCVERKTLILAASSLFVAGLATWLRVPVDAHSNHKDRNNFRHKC